MDLTARLVSPWQGAILSLRLLETLLGFLLLFLHLSFNCYRMASARHLRPIAHLRVTQTETYKMTQQRGKNKHGSEGRHISVSQHEHKVINTHLDDWNIPPWEKQAFWQCLPWGKWLLRGVIAWWSWKIHWRHWRKDPMMALLNQL